MKTNKLLCEGIGYNPAAAAVTEIDVDGIMWKRTVRTYFRFAVCDGAYNWVIKLCLIYKKKSIRFAQSMRFPWNSFAFK